jgi:hypothetical protein
MAHECPKCYALCYCGGDIDDLCLNLDADVGGCTHCPHDLDDNCPEYDWDGFDED